MKYLNRLLPGVASLLVAGLAAVPAATETVPNSNGGVVSREFVGSGSKSAIDGRGYTLDFGGTTTYDSNILRDGSNIDTTRRKDDVIFSPAGTLAVGLPLGRQQLFGTFTIGRDYYLNNTDFDRTRINVGGGANLKYGPFCDASLYGQYSERQGTQLDLAIVVPNKQQDTTYQINAGCGRQRGLGFGGGFTRYQTANSNNGLLNYNLFDSTSSTFSANARYNAGARGVLTLTGSYSDINYPNRPIFQVVNQTITPTGMKDGVNVYSGQIAFSRVIGPLFNFNIGVSYVDAKPKPGSNSASYAGPGFDVSVSYHPGTRITGSLSATRNVTASSNVGSLFTIDANYGLDVTYKLSPRISTGFGGSLSQRDYRGSFASTQLDAQAAAVIGAQPRVSDTLYRGYVSASYAPTRRYSFDVLVAQQGRKSNPSTFNFNSTSASASLHVRF